MLADETLYQTAAQVAAELGIAPAILRRWERDGMVPEPAVDPRGTRV